MRGGCSTPRSARRRSEFRSGSSLDRVPDFSPARTWCMSSGFELVPYEPGHRDDYLGLLREAWGPGSMTPEHFDWWFGRNPAGSLMSVAQRDGKVVGVAAHSLFRMVLGGERR